MAKFAYNNVKIASIGHTSFELNCGYYSCIFFEENTNFFSLSKIADELSIELQNLMTVYQENFHHVQEFQKQFHNKGVKPKSYASDNKVWLNTKYIKTKQNWKLEAKFFRAIQVLYPVGKQAYKLKLSKQWKINNIFYMSLLEQDITKKELVDEKITKLEFESGNSKEYKIEAI